MAASGAIPRATSTRTASRRSNTARRIAREERPRIAVVVGDDGRRRALALALLRRDAGPALRERVRLAVERVAPREAAARVPPERRASCGFTGLRLERQLGHARRVQLAERPVVALHRRAERAAHLGHACGRRVLEARRLLAPPAHAARSRNSPAPG